MKKFVSTFLLVTIAFYASISTFAIPPVATVKKAQTMVENARYQLPAEVVPGMMLTQLSYDSKTYSLVYRYHYTVSITKPTTTAINEAKLGMIHMLKANPNSEDMQYLKDGITFYYNYYDQDGKFIYAVKITPADIK